MRTSIFMKFEQESFSNAPVESIFSVYRRREKENYSFEKLHVLSLGSFNKTVEWIQGHKDRDDIIAKAGFQKNFEFDHTRSF